MSVSSYPPEPPNAYDVKLLRQTCPHCGHRLAYFTGLTVSRQTPKAATTESEVKRHFTCADATCRHHWTT